MRWKQCPLCAGPLETRDVAPCHECGGLEIELKHFREGRHTFQRLRIFPQLTLELTLCNFCMVDFGSYDPRYFGLPRRARIGFEHMQLVRDVDGAIGKDKHCPVCSHRLAFLKFVSAAREQFALASDRDD